MNAPVEGLFRKEVRQHRADRLHGDVSILVPVSWQAIGYGIAASVAIAIAFLAIASYSRVEAVVGTIVLDRGVSPVVATRSGIVSSISAREGDIVTPGTHLIQVVAEETGTNGGASAGRIIG